MLVKGSDYIYVKECQIQIKKNNKKIIVSLFFVINFKAIAGLDQEAEQR